MTQFPILVDNINQVIMNSTTIKVRMAFHFTFHLLGEQRYTIPITTNTPSIFNKKYMLSPSLIYHCLFLFLYKKFHIFSHVHVTYGRKNKKRRLCVSLLCVSHSFHLLMFSSISRADFSTETKILLITFIKI